jgi:hypothetical protein
LKLRKKIYETEITLRKANWKKNETQFINNIILKDKIKKKTKKKEDWVIEGWNWKEYIFNWKVTKKIKLIQLGSTYQTNESIIKSKWHHGKQIKKIKPN